MHKLRVPLVNANEDEVLIVEILVEEGDAVKKGDLLYVVESTKATLDVEAPISGFVRKIFGRVDQRLKVGTLMLLLTESADEAFELDEKVRISSDSEGRFTKKAALLAGEAGITAADMGLTGIIKEKDVQAYLESRGVEEKKANLDEARARIDKLLAPNSEKESVIIYGAGGHAGVLVDLIAQGYPEMTILGLIDDRRQPGEEIFGLPILGPKELLPYIQEAGVKKAVLGVGAVTNNRLRVELFEALKSAGFEVPNLIHPSAAVEPSVTMGEGNQIFAGAVLSSNVRLGKNTIINSNAVVSHDCRIGDHSHLTPAAVLAGGVTIGSNTVVGMAATIYLGLHVGSNVLIANGLNVMTDVADNQLLKA